MIGCFLWMMYGEAYVMDGGTTGRLCPPLMLSMVISTTRPRCLWRCYGGRSVENLIRCVRMMTMVGE